LRARYFCPTTVSLAALAAGSGGAHATEVISRGGLEIAIGGSVQSLAAYGSLKAKRGDKSGRLGFEPDLDVRLEARGSDPRSALDYGAIIDLSRDADTGGPDRKGFAFLRGRFGEARFGDDEGVVENMALGGFTIAVGTGGTDGKIIDTEATVFILSSDATKAVYYSPQLAGFRLGISFAPHLDSQGGDLGGTDDGELDDVLEAGLSFTAEVAEIDLGASVVGTLGHADRPTGRHGSQATGLYGGFLAGIDELEIAAGIGTADLAGVERRWLNIGAAYAIEPVTLSVNLGRIFGASAPNGRHASKPYNLVLGGELALAPGLAFSLELSIFDDSRIDDDSNRRDAGDRGVIGLTRIEVVF